MRNPENWFTSDDNTENREKAIDNRREQARKIIDKIEEFKREPEKHLASIWNYYRAMIVMKNRNNNKFYSKKQGNSIKK